MVLFILFNSDGNSVEQWKRHPYNDSIKTTLLTKLKKLGNVYIYNPIFYNFNKFNPNFNNTNYNNNFKFTLESIDLEEHCQKLFEEVYKTDDQFILISHGNGFMIAHAFANLYNDNVYGLINIDGCMSKDLLKTWLDQDKLEFIKKIKKRELQVLFENLESNINVSDTVNLLNFVVKYHIYKQYYKSYIDNDYFDCDVVLFVNINPLNNLETLDKFKFCNDIVLNNENVKVFSYLEKSNYLYFDIEKDIVNVIKKIVESLENTIKVDNF